MRALSPRHASAVSRKTKRIHPTVEELESRTLLSAAPFYLLPPEIRGFYGFDQVKFAGGSIPGDGRGQTIAIVDAFDNPNVAADLNVFDKSLSLTKDARLDPNTPDAASIYSQYGDASAFFSKNSFKKADGTTATTPWGIPTGDVGWGQEIALDVQWAHVVAPAARILLVEAASNSTNDLLAAVDWAASQPGVSVVSMSWGGGEFPSETSLDSHFGVSGVTFIASSGDSGGGIGWPAVSPNVVAVGGTTIHADAAGTETAWTGSSGGRSYYEGTPSYQQGLSIHSGTATYKSNGKRVGPDVAYNADPNSGVVVYDSYGSSPGWYVFGGTSAGAPQWAGLIAIADQGRALNGLSPLSSDQALSAFYTHTGDFYDVTSGRNYLARAGKGFDPVTGLGTPYANFLIAHLSGLTFAATVHAGTKGAAGKGTGSGTASRHLDGADRSTLPEAVGLLATPPAKPTAPATAPLLSNDGLPARVPVSAGVKPIAAETGHVLPDAAPLFEEILPAPRFVEPFIAETTTAPLAAPAIPPSAEDAISRHDFTSTRSAPFTDDLALPPAPALIAADDRADDRALAMPALIALVGLWTPRAATPRKAILWHVS